MNMICTIVAFTSPHHRIVWPPLVLRNGNESSCHHQRLSMVTQFNHSTKKRERKQLPYVVTKLQLSTDSSSSDANDDLGDPYYRHLLSQFQGDFDNYNQVVQDRKHALTPGDEGGHEHIHCTLVPCPHYNNNTYSCQWILAAFYFNGNPRQIFRFRLYQLIPSMASEGSPLVRMELNTLMPQLERQLRECSEQPCIWWKEVFNVWCRENKMEASSSMTNAENWDRLLTVGMSTMTSPLKGCDVLWKSDWDPTKHAYLYKNEYDDDILDSTIQKPELPKGKSYHATMEVGSKGAIVDSISMIPGQRILIKDELSLWQDEFWINDRGYDPDAKIEDDESMPFVYGNRRGVPYKLQRVSKFCITPEKDSKYELDRVIANSDMEWSLGEKYRTPALFEKKMEPISS